MGGGLPEQVVVYSIGFAQSQIQYGGYKDTLNESGHIWEYNPARRNYVNTELYGNDVTDLGDYGYIQLLFSFNGLDGFYVHLNIYPDAADIYATFSASITATSGMAIGGTVANEISGRTTNIQETANGYTISFAYRDFTFRYI